MGILGISASNHCTKWCVIDRVWHVIDATLFIGAIYIFIEISTTTAKERKTKNLKWFKLDIYIFINFIFDYFFPTGGISVFPHLPCNYCVNKKYESIYPH